jgi:hypothetical protein
MAESTLSSDDVCRAQANVQRSKPLIDQSWANEFAKEWIASWNSHDLERILSHYVDDFEMSSPLIIARKKDPSGVLRRKSAIRDYWAIGLAADRAAITLLAARGHSDTAHSGDPRGGTTERDCSDRDDGRCKGI